MLHWASLVVQMVICLQCRRPLGQEDPLEKGMAIHSIILAWKIPWTEEPGGLQSMGLQRGGEGSLSVNEPFLFCNIILYEPSVAPTEI